MLNLFSIESHFSVVESAYGWNNRRGSRQNLALLQNRQVDYDVLYELVFFDYFDYGYDFQSVRLEIRNFDHQN